MIRTKLCDLLGIEYPILQGGMAWVSTAELVAAVSEAGGLGIIGSGQAPPEWLEEQVSKIRKITNKPFGVNVMLMSPYADQVMDIVIRERIPVVTTGAGNPGKYVAGLKEVGTKVIPVVPSVALAKRMERSGVDAIIAEGGESGGHVGEQNTMPLVPQVVDAVNIPVIAAGGIFDGRGLVAALALGAVGVQMGTRFMCASECVIHDNVKKVLLKAKDRDTVVTGRSTGHPVRVIKNKLAKRFEELEMLGTPPEELEKLGVGKLRAAMVDGDIEYGSVMAGQVCGMIKKIQPAKEIIEDIITGAEEVLKRLPGGGN
ncbi:enoyl-[acyl-carrier protein] reductase II [Desulfohalotomaculum tongense]|uniref:enoyl-[acyl-carrier-protein] reductase FabK n=1 Tax=Desulforadius tongensis TaxID=1216062 RepID=UPI00195DD751|nr:enoyl-[acyl-carrier-protein] reductase FabK [Desulforadius tongensis]MBM7854398.1 enoyl-[acyl-carrier protein] reductase II [Desulforadius tongensis]